MAGFRAPKQYALMELDRIRGTRAYQLHVKVDGGWSWVGTIEAPTHADAFRQALLALGPADKERPIRFEQDLEGAYRKPCKPHARPLVPARDGSSGRATP